MPPAPGKPATAVRPATAAGVPGAPVPARDRWLALAILAGVLALAYLLLLHGWWTVPMRELASDIETTQERDVRIRRELAQAPQVRAELERARAAFADVPGFMPQANVELATAALVQRLETAVAEASPGNRSCAISNRSPLAASRSDPYPRATVQVRLRCGNPELAAVLHALETGTPRLFVDNLNILSQRHTLAPGTESGGLDVSFDLYGFVLPPASAGAASDAPADAPTGAADGV
uniref:type II secretion system protein GspM n=1 Tax=Luteimonas sp. 4-12 TaxID=2027406 RepID=UPI001E5AE841|nr:type II secretion system protein GspM [Luteimonas sp. 4-12]